MDTTPEPGRSERTRELVDEPLRRALGWLIYESIAAFALVAVAVGCPAILTLDGPSCDAVHLGGPLLLAAWVIGSWGVRTIRPHPRLSPAEAWATAYRIDPGEAQLAIAIATISTVAVGVAFAAIVRFYFLEPGMGATTITVLLPALLALYLGVIATGYHNVRDRLARGMDESDGRFRAYWREIADRRADPG